MQTKTDIEYAFRVLVFFVISVILGANFYVLGNAVTEAEAKPLQKNSAFDSFTLDAHSAFVYDLASDNVLFEYNADSILPLASLTKIATAITAKRIGKAGELVTITAASVARSGDQGLIVGDLWSADDLIPFTLISSSNDGAHALGATIGEERFVYAMNETARAGGLHNTYFFNSTGLDISENTNGGYSTAREYAILFAEAIRDYPDVITPTRKHSIQLASLSGNLYTVKNTNESVVETPSVIASKTGYTELAGGNLAVTFDAGLQHPIVIVVLGSTLDGRFSDVSKLIDAAITEITTNQGLK